MFVFLSRLLTFISIPFKNKFPVFGNIFRNFKPFLLIETNLYDLFFIFQDLRTLEKFFQELLSLFEDSSNCKFMSIIFNTSVSCLGKELKRQLKTGFPLEHIKRNGFPYVTKRILSLIFDGNQLQELCLCTLENLILNYKDVRSLKLMQFNEGKFADFLYQILFRFIG